MYDNTYVVVLELKFFVISTLNLFIYVRKIEVSYSMTLNRQSTYYMSLHIRNNQGRCGKAIANFVFEYMRNNNINDTQCSVRKAHNNYSK